MGDWPSHDGARHRLRLLGSFGFFAPDGTRLPITSRKSIALLALVALARSGERSRTWLQSQLWGSREPDQARASLRRELSNLRLAINPSQGAPLLIADSRRVRLDLARLDIDVRELNANVANARRASLTDPGALLEGLDVPGEEGFEDWLREQRQHVAGLIAQLQIQDWERVSLADPADDSANGSATPSGRKPSVGVVAFTLRTSDQDDRAIADGMTDEIGDALSRFSTLFVALAGPRPERPVDHSALCRELGVRYLLEGSIARDGDTIGIQVRLTDGVVREQIWAQRFEATLAELFAVQSEIAQTVAQQIDSSVEIAERTRAVTQRVTTPDAYHLYWRANALFRQWERGSMLEAIATAQQVLELEPHNAWASALAAFCHSIVFTFGWADDPDATRAAALSHYEHCLRHGESDPFVLGYAAGALIGVGGDVEIADQLIERALAIHPASGASLFWGGWVDLACSKPARAIVRFESALRMNPRSAVRPLAMTGIGIGQLVLGDLGAARSALRDAVQYMPHSPVTLAGLILVYALDGDHAGAAPFVARLDALGGGQAVRAAIRDPGLRATLDAILARYAKPQADKASLRIVSRMAGDNSR
ncbi:hypothetical protein [Sphingomonas psychrolutea]|uniref:Transcriptional regulator n=1 Tax=Sphingomonas psychrolutea TaxID=1259676 RepID=A0ABQ1GZF9_9SPHN|nr:hypothetical protein [Sphingomonas psychrolutea]GGA53747.1 hypothetical protein GCM10011395_25200 [Sphingomonas psychrolutea]